MFPPKGLSFSDSLVAGFPVATFQPMTCAEKTVCGFWAISLIGRVFTFLLFSFCAAKIMYVMAGALAAVLGHPALWPVGILVDKQSAIPVYTVVLWGLFGGAVNPYWWMLPVGVAVWTPEAISMLAHVVCSERKPERPQSQTCNSWALGIWGDCHFFSCLCFLFLLYFL